MSPESVVDAAYRAVLAREPDPEGRQAMVQAIREGRLSVTELIAGMLASPEYRRAHTDDTLTFSTTKPVCTLIQDRLRLWVDLADRFVSLGCLLGDYEPSETRFILSNLASGDVFLDIGANVGWFSVLAADRVGPTGRVHAFEPRAETARLLDRSIADNGFSDRVTLHVTALGAEDGESRLLGSETSTNLGGFRLARDADEAFPRMTSETVSLTALDSLPIEAPVRLIKLDVEGAEPQVLEGARRLIARDRPLILSEVFAPGLRHVSSQEPADYAALVAELGYRMHALIDGAPGELIADAAVLDAPHPVNVVLIPTEA